MDENEKFLLRVDGWVVEGIESGFHSLEELSSELPGVYPTCIRDSICKLALSKDINPELAKSLLQPAVACRSASAFSETDRLPLPHPLDFEWRFSWEASESLLRVARRLSRENDEILLLSAPSVFYYAIQSKDLSGIRYIGDKTVVTEFLCGISNTGAKCDFLTPSPDLAKASVVVIDPPWYEEYFRTFFWLASRSCKIGGYVVLSFPPEGTRPGIDAEWLRFLKFANQLGMIHLVDEKGLLPYDSPFFEVNALHAEGINIPRCWRKGIMHVFRKVAEIHTPIPLAKPLEKWNEVQLGSVRLKLRPTISTKEIDPLLSAVVPGEIFPSVSRRDPRREQADVWTSGNRIFKCRRPDILEHVIAALQHQESPVETVGLLTRGITPVEKIAIEETAIQLSNIIEKEKREFLSLIYGTHD